MKKKLIAILALSLLAVILLAGCGGYNQKPVNYGAKAADPVTGNGGLVVRKGDFYYYINGKASSAADLNKWGKTVKGALMCSPVDNLSEKVTIVPKLFYSEYAEGGFSIYGNYIYYTSPNDEKNKKGEIQYGYMDFMRTKLDGTGAEKLATSGTESQSIPHRYFYDAAADQVTLAYVANSKVYTMNCNDKKSLTEAVTEFTGSPVFGPEGDNAIYYTASVYTHRITGEEVTAEDYKNASDDEKANIKTESYNKVMRYDIGEKKEKEIYRNKSYTVTLTKFEATATGSYMYYTKAEIAGGSGAKLLCRSDANKTIGDVTEASGETVISYYNTSLSGYLTAPGGDGIIAQNSKSIDWILEKDGMIYTHPLSTTTGATLFQIMNNTLYYFDAASVLYQLALPTAAEVRNGIDWSDHTSEKVLKDTRRDKDATIDTMDTGWIKPEYMDGKWFFFNSAADGFDANTKDKAEKYSHATMYFRSGYLFVYDTKATDNVWPVRIGQLTADDSKSESDKLKEENETRDKNKAEAEAQA